MKEDNISQLGDYDVPFCEQQYTHGSCYISLFKFRSFDQFNTPQPASNFRHLLSCGTIGGIFRAERYFLLFKATSHSTIFDIPMRPLRKDQKHRHRFTR